VAASSVAWGWLLFINHPHPFGKRLPPGKKKRYKISHDRKPFRSMKYVSKQPVWKNNIFEIRRDRN
jgi:hypothetical protein